MGCDVCEKVRNSCGGVENPERHGGGLEGKRNTRASRLGRRGCELTYRKSRKGTISRLRRKEKLEEKDEGGISEGRKKACQSCEGNLT